MTLLWSLWTSFKLWCLRMNVIPSLCLVASYSCSKWPGRYNYIVYKRLQGPLNPFSRYSPRKNVLNIQILCTLKLAILMGPLLAIQPFSHTLTSDYIWKLAFGYPWDKCSLPFCVQPICGAKEYQTCTDTALSGYQFTPWLRWSLADPFLLPTEIQVRPV